MGALSDFAGAVAAGGLALGVVVSGDFIAALPDLFAFARQASFSAAGRFAHAFVAIAVALLPEQPSSACPSQARLRDKLGVWAPAAIAVPNATAKASCFTCIRIMLVSLRGVVRQDANRVRPARFDGEGATMTRLSAFPRFPCRPQPAYL
jgi:hypothetical protein